MLTEIVCYMKTNDMKIRQLYGNSKLQNFLIITATACLVCYTILIVIISKSENGDLGAVLDRKPSIRAVSNSETFSLPFYRL